MDSNTSNILLTGDITQDHYILLGDRKTSDSPKDKTGTNITSMKGGSYLLYDFLSAFKKSENSHFGLETDHLDTLPPQNQSYAIVSKVKDPDGKSEALRITQSLGYGKFTTNYRYKSKLAESNYDVLLIDDAGLDFSSHVNQKAWPKGLGKSHKLVIYKKSGDIRKGELWKEMLNNSNNGDINLISILSIKDIRNQEAKVSTRISWEQSALDIVYEIKNNVNLSDLQKSKYLIVTFQSSGAVLIINNGKDPFEYKLVFDPLHLEDEWEEERKGSVIGRMACFTAAFAAKLDLNKPEKHYKIEEAIISGLASIRGFIDIGYFTDNDDVLKLPLNKIMEATAKHANTYTSAFIPTPDHSSDFLKRNWTILLDNYNETKSSPTSSAGSMFELGRSIVMNGLHVLNNIPSARFRNLYTVDRIEIESLRNIKKLIVSYKDQKGPAIPLSIAVFGLPGSGKSFGVKEIGRGVMGEKVPILEFNLSQFAGPTDIIGALHQVRDEVLKGATPLVFWDEFDSKKYEWLQYLLAPMQDGAFQEGQITHTIGKCIMVFAGGTSYKMETFGALKGDALEDFKLKKGPDFISRIHGYINILGPNPGLRINEEGIWETDPSDFCYPIRRALFIRQIFGLKPNDHLEIDWGLLNALLKVGKFKHGSRSLANLLKSLKENSDGGKISRCQLPSNSILELYVDEADQFLKLLNENSEYYESTYKIAPAIHGIWSQTAQTKNLDYLVAFDLLPVFIKASNINAAVRIPMVLGKANLKIVPNEGNKTMTNTSYQNTINRDDKRLLEMMAEEEHRLWMQFYLQNDWQYGEERNDYAKVHNCLVDYHDPRLSETERDKDREQVERYWEFLKLVGFGVVLE